MNNYIFGTVITRNSLSRLNVFNEGIADDQRILRAVCLERPQKEWHLLEDHLKNVAEMAGGVKKVLMQYAPTRYVVFDVETTGLSAAIGHRIIEIGSVAVNGDAMGEEFQSLIYTEKPIRKAAQKIHGITAEMLAGQPDAKQVLSAFRRFVGTSTLVAHNAAFDIAFLQREFIRAGLILNNRHKCTLLMSRKQFPGLLNYKLETVARHLDIPVNMRKRHQALDDARLVAKVWVEMNRAHPRHSSESRNPGYSGFRKGCKKQ